MLLLLPLLIILFTVVILVAVDVLVEFIEAKDGMLRKIMIVYFAIEVFTYTVLLAYIVAGRVGYHLPDIRFFALALILPKFAVKMWLRWWLKKGRKLPAH